MRNVVAFVCLFSITYLHAQSARPPKSVPTASLPSADLVFSRPNLDSPLQLPSTMMNGAPTCGADGTAFIQFLTPPPMYNYKVVFSISPAGKVLHYPVEHVDGLSDVYIVSFDPGISNPAMLLNARASGQSRGSSTGYYLALFDHDGTLGRYSRLDLGFQPSKVAQLSDNSFLVVGADTEARSRFMIVDSSGSVLRNLDADAIMPSEQRLKSMSQSMSFAGGTPADLPPSMRVSAVLSLFRLAHSQEGLLILQPGAEAQITKILPSGDIHIVTLHLPKNQVADSIITNKGRWFVRTSLQGSDSQSNLYEVDPETGNALKHINTSGVPALSIACPSDSGFYGLRWVEQKAFLVFGELR